MTLLVGVPKDWKREAKRGLLWLGLFVLANIFFPQVTSIGFPVKLQTFTTTLVAAVVFAPIVEELLFRLAMINFLGAIRVPVLLIIIITAAVFTVFHYAAYGASFDAQSASFVGAFLFGIIVGWIAIRNGSIITPIVIHSGFNLWLLLRLYVS